MAKFRVETDQGNYEIETEDKSLASKAWDSLTVPEQKAKEGLNLITKGGVDAQNAIAEKTGLPIGTEPTGNMARDLIANTPRIAGETLAEVAPSFVSRGAILTAGALKSIKTAAPLIKAGAKAIGSQLESASGIAPKAEGALNAAFNDPTLITAADKATAQPLYQAAKAKMAQGSNLFSGEYKPEAILDKAMEYMADGGKLEPPEALMARKAVDVLMKSGRYVKDELFALRDTFDQIAKTSPEIAKADPIVARGIRADALRQVLPQNKTGGVSLLKSALLKWTGGLASPIVSPAVQGYGATAAGIGARKLAPLVNNPETGTAISALLDRFRKK